MCHQVLVDGLVEEGLRNDPHESLAAMLRQNERIHFRDAVDNTRRVADGRGLAMLIHDARSDSVVQKVFF